MSVDFSSGCRRSLTLLTGVVVTAATPDTDTVPP
jgi:hypothetical protein